MSQPKLIALDWGTTSARAFLMSEESDVLGQRTSDFGVMNVMDNDFEGALIDLCGPWLMVRTSTPIVACGMVGSSLGWALAPYVDCAAGLNDLSTRLTEVDIGRKLFSC